MDIWGNNLKCKETVYKTDRKYDSKDSLYPT